MKKLIISIAISLSILGLVIFFWIKNKSDLINKQTLLPSFSTSDFPAGKVGESYQAELTGTLIGAKAKLEIKALQIPEGLSLNNCKQSFNLDLIPKPNTFIRCNLSGYPTKNKVFESLFELSAKDYTNKVIGSFEINIIQ